MAVRQWSVTINNYTEEDYKLLVDARELCKYLIIGREIGEEGTPHLQCYASFLKPMSLRQMKVITPRAHLEKVKGTPWDNKKYCSKDGDFEEYGTIPTEPKERRVDADLDYNNVLQQDTVRAGMDVIKAKRSRDYCLYGEQIERNLKRHHVVLTTSKYNIDDFLKSPLCLDKPVLLTGPSNTGKTQFALAHFDNPLMVSHIDKLKQLSPDHDGIVFDDMSFKHWPIEAVIHLLDTECDRDLNVRYGTVMIPAGTKKIFTHNTPNPFYEEFLIDTEQKTAIERRFDRVNVLNKLY